MKRILITGVSGFLGYNLFNFLKGRFRVKGTFHRHSLPGEGEEAVFLDLRDKTAVEKLASEFQPEIVIHTAAVTSPAECRKDPETAQAVNVAGTVHIAEASARTGSRLIYTSTDRVFDGLRGNYNEDDPPNPLGRYGKTKLRGESEVGRIAPNSLILRLPLLYGPPSPTHGSFISWMIEAFEEKKPLDLFTDQVRTPLYVVDACRALELLIDRPDLAGIYHLGGGEKIDRAEFGYRMAEIFGYNPSIIRPIRMAEKPHQPPSPADASLNSDKLYRAIGFRGRGVMEGLLALKKELSI